MALVLKDRVKQTAAAPGTGTITLSGSVTGFQSFSVIGNGNSTYFAIYDPVSGAWEVNYGTYTSSGTTLTRNATPLSSSNSGSLVNFTGVVDVFVTYPSENAVWRDTSGVVVQQSFGDITATSAALTTGTITTAPANATDIVNKEYADSISSGLNYHQPVNYASTTTLPTYIYNNGASGVGATITAVANGALSLGGGSPTATQRVLIKDEVAGNAPYNGIYVVTQAGSSILPFILTRATDYDTSGAGTNEIDQGDYVLVISGTLASTAWVQQTPLPITVGTTGLVFLQFNAPITYYAGTGLTLSPATTFNIATTGVSAATYGSASSVPVITVNSQGQATVITNTAIAINGSAVSGNISGSAGSVANALTLGTYLTGTSYNGSAAVTAAVDATSANTASKVVARDSSGNFSAGTITATLSGAATSATTATNIAGGAANQIPYQTGAATTSFVAAPTVAGTYLNWTGSAFAYSAISLPNNATFNNGGAGDASGTTFNGSAARTISYNTVGASPLAGSSSLTTTGTVTSGTWSASFGAVSGANLTSLTAGNLSGTIPSAVLGNSTAYVGTTAVALNRASGNLALTGILSETYVGSTSGTTQVIPNAVAGTGTVLTLPNTTGTLALTSDLPTVNNATLTMNTSGTGLSGSQTFTANQATGATFTVASNATNANTASTIVARDASGNFSAGTITATLSGAATSATTAGTITSQANSATITATSANTASQIVLRDASGNFSAGTITATLSGNATSATTASILTTGSSIKRTAAGTGYLDGQYSSVETTLTSGAIYSIGNAYPPGTTTLGSMYGIGYTYSGGAAGNPGGVPSNIWGMYVASGGTARIWLDSDNGRGYFASNLYVNGGTQVVYNSGTWAISISGTAATATSAPNYLPLAGGTMTGPMYTATYDNSSKVMFNSASTYYLGLTGNVATGGGSLSMVQYTSATGTAATAVNSYPLLHSNNYNSYAPTLTGTGASGTWAISISGNAATATTATNQSGGTVSATTGSFSSTISTSTPSYYSALSNLGFVGAIRSGETNVGASGSVYIPYISQTSLSNSGYRQHTVFGSYRGQTWDSAFIAVGGNDSYPTVAYYFNTGGDFTAPGSARAPIFYDSNNTAYYVDPAGSTALNINGGITFAASNPYISASSYFVAPGGAYFSSGTVYFQSQFYARGGIGNDGAAALTLSGGTSGYTQINGSARSPIFYDSDNTGYYVDPNSTSNLAEVQTNRTYGFADIRSPIFYDYNNTAYYVDPASISSMYGVAIRGDQSSIDSSNQIFFWGGGNTTTSAIGFKANGGGFSNPTGNGDGYNTYLTMDTSGRGWVFREGVGGTNFSAAYTSGWILNNGIWQANASMRAPIFYDSNNTGYYVDPASTSRMNTINADSLYSYGNVTAYSDERLKKDWEELPNNFVEELAKVKSGTYTRIDSGERQVGVGAQSLQVILKEAVSEKEEYLGVHYGNAAMVSAVELAKEVIDLRARVAQLESLISKLIGD